MALIGHYSPRASFQGCQSPHANEKDLVSHGQGFMLRERRLRERSQPCMTGGDCTSLCISQKPVSTAAAGTFSLVHSLSDFLHDQCALPLASRISSGRCVQSCLTKELGIGLGYCSCLGCELRRISTLHLSLSHYYCYTRRVWRPIENKTASTYIPSNESHCSFLECDSCNGRL
jgi:hypothetical protein